MLKKFQIILLSIIISACSVKESKIAISHINNSNFNNNGEEVPILIYLYELKSPNQFEIANIKDLVYQSDKVLGKDLISISKYQVIPDTTINLRSVVIKDVPFVGVVAVYSNIANKDWKQVIDMNKYARKEMYLELDKNGIIVPFKK